MGRSDERPICLFWGGITLIIAYLDELIRRRDRQAERLWS